MYTSEQVIDLVEASYERGFSEGARQAYDTVAFLESYEAATEDDDPDGSEYDALYLEVTGQKVDDLTERVAGLERWAYAYVTPHVTDDEHEYECSRDCLCRR